MSKAKFEKAVSIVQSLPKDGPIKPTQDEQLIVREWMKALMKATITRDYASASFFLRPS